jgi:protoporphyrinogen/coproporphyrinogen III oxidase
VPQSFTHSGMSTIAVVGAGIAGLTAAHQLSADHDVIVFEREASAGGKIRSQQLDGYLFEWGPASILSSDEGLGKLASELGLSDALVPMQPSAKNRYIYWAGALHRLPAKPPEAMTFALLTPLGRLRALGELLIPKRSNEQDESVFAFMRRRFGRQVAERIVSPALLGVSGGDAATTSLDAIFPRLRAMEAEGGSILRAMMKGPRKPASTLTFAAGGMQTLTDRLAERLAGRLRLGVAVERIEPVEAGWRVIHSAGETTADAVIVATSAPAAAGLIEGFDAELAARLHDIPYAPMRVVGVAFRAEDVPVPLDGFGFLAARGQGIRILGALYTSSMVPGHAPAATAYLRIFLGGSTDPKIATLDAAAVRSIVLTDLQKALGISAAPIAYHEIVWPDAIPQYNLGHRSLLASIETLEAKHPRFVLTGNAYRGLGVGDTVRDAHAVAARLSAGV